MFTVSYLSYCGFQFNGHTDIDRRDVEMMIQNRNQGLKLGLDYLFQPMATSWQVSGITPLGARAVATIAQSHKFIPNRLDVVTEIHDVGGLGYLDYDLQVTNLEAWFKVHKPKLNVTHMLPLGGDRKVLFGSRNSRWCLWVSERTDPQSPFGGSKLVLEWAMRNENCFALWEYFVRCGGDKDWEHYSQEGFAACTNTILGPDFFRLSHSEMPYLRKEKPDADKKDWYAYLSGVAKKMVRHYLDEPDASCENDVTFLTREIARELDKVEGSMLQ